MLIPTGLLNAKSVVKIKHVQGVILDDDTVDNLVTIAGEELDEAL